MSIILFDAKPSVFNHYLQVRLHFTRVDINIIFNWNDVLDVTLHGILDCIWLKSEHDLHESRVIGHDNFLVAFEFELATELDWLIVSFILLHTNHTLHEVFDVESTYIFSKLLRIDLRIIKQILNVHRHKLTARFLDLLSILQLSNQSIYLTLQTLQINIILSQQFLNNLMNIILLHVSGLDRIQWISQLMGDRGV